MTQPLFDPDEDQRIAAEEEARERMEALAAAARAVAEPDPAWEPGAVLSYQNRRRKRGRGRHPGHPAIGIVAATLGASASVFGLFGAILGILLPPDVSPAAGLLLLASLLLALLAIATGTAARKWELSHSLGTIGRWLGFAAPIAMMLPVAAVAFVHSPLAAVSALALVSIVVGVIAMLLVLVIDPILGTE